MFSSYAISTTLVIQPYRQISISFSNFLKRTHDHGFNNDNFKLFLQYPYHLQYFIFRCAFSILLQYFQVIFGMTKSTSVTFLYSIFVLKYQYWNQFCNSKGQYQYRLKYYQNHYTISILITVFWG